MEYRRLGNSGLQVSAIGLGTNNFGARIEEQPSVDVVRQCVEVGINFIDTANSYSGTLSEQYIGKAISSIRDKVVIATKVYARMGDGPNQMGASRLHIMHEVESSLRRLQTDYIDLYQMHYWDPHTPIEETPRALDDLVRQGKVRYIGCSNYTAWQVCEAVWTSRTLNLEPFVSVQPHWNMVNRGIERELVPFCRPTTWASFAIFPLPVGFSLESTVAESLLQRAVASMVRTGFSSSYPGTETR